MTDTPTPQSTAAQLRETLTRLRRHAEGIFSAAAELERAPGVACGSLTQEELLECLGWLTEQAGTTAASYRELDDKIRDPGALRDLAMIGALQELVRGAAGEPAPTYPTRRAGAQPGDTARGSGGDQDASARAEAPGSAPGDSAGDEGGAEPDIMSLRFDAPEKARQRAAEREIEDASGAIRRYLRATHPEDAPAPTPPPGDAPLTTTEMAERLTSNEAWDGHAAIRWGYEVARAYLALVATPPPDDAEELARTVRRMHDALRLDAQDDDETEAAATRIRSLGAELARERERGDKLRAAMVETSTDEENRLRKELAEARREREALREDLAAVRRNRDAQVERLERHVKSVTENAAFWRTLYFEQRDGPGSAALGRAGEGP